MASRRSRSERHARSNGHRDVGHTTMAAATSATERDSASGDPRPVKGDRWPSDPEATYRIPDPACLGYDVPACLLHRPDGPLDCGAK